MNHLVCVPFKADGISISSSESLTKEDIMCVEEEVERNMKISYLDVGCLH